MPIHEDNDPNYARVVSMTSGAPPISPGQPKQNGQQIMNALSQGTSAKPTQSTGFTSVGSQQGPGSAIQTAPNMGGADSDMYAGATDSVLGADAGLDAAGAAGTAAGAAEGAEGAEGIGELADLFIA